MSWERTPMNEPHDASIAQREPHEIPVYRIDAYVPERQVDEMYGVCTSGPTSAASRTASATR